MASQLSNALPRLRSERVVFDRAPWLVTAALLALMFAASPNFHPTHGEQASPLAGDCLQEWIGGWIVAHGDANRLYDLEYARELEHDAALVGFTWRKAEYFPMVYPPFYYLLVSPLSHLPFPLAAVIWLGLMVLALFIAWHIYHRTIPGVDHWQLPLMLLFTPLIESLTSGQKGTVLLCLFTATYALLARGRPLLAGLVFGFIAFKPQLAIPFAVAMLLKQQWRFVGGGLITGLVLVSLCFRLGGDVCGQYVEFSRHATEYIRNSGYNLAKSHAWNGFWELLLGGLGSPQLVQICVCLSSAATLGCVAWAWRGKLETTCSGFSRQFTQLILCTILVSPHVYTYDLTVLLLPLGFLALEKQHGTALRGTQWCGLALFCFAGISPRFAAISGIQITVPLMFTWCWLLASARTPAEPTSSGTSVKFSPSLSM